MWTSKTSKLCLFILYILRGIDLWGLNVQHTTSPWCYMQHARHHVLKIKKQVLSIMQWWKTKTMMSLLPTALLRDTGQVEKNCAMLFGILVKTNWMNIGWKVVKMFLWNGKLCIMYTFAFEALQMLGLPMM